MADPLIIVGGGGFAMEVCWLAQEAGWAVQGFLDDAHANDGRQVLDLPVLGGVDDWVRHRDAQFVVAVGAPRTRCRIVSRMGGLGQPRFATVVHPTVRASRWVRFGEGAMVTAGCIVTTDVEIGRHAILNLNVTVGHECRFGEFVTVAPLAAISGNVRLHDLVEVGTGAAIRQGLEIGEGAVLGMGGVLTRSMEPRAVYVGNPAKLLKTLDD